LAEQIQRTAAVAGRGIIVAATALLLGLAPAVAHADSSVTVSAHDFGTNAPLSDFTYIVNEDNVGDPSSPNPSDRPSIHPTESHSKLVAQGDQAHATATLPDGKYLISIRSPEHKIWGKHITLPDDAGPVDVGLRKGPFPLGKIRVFVFNDNAPTNSAPEPNEAGLQGFHVTIEEQTNSQVTVDYNNDPLCGGDCVTGPDGSVTLDNLGPATYFVYVTPPDEPCGNGGQWVQTSTFDGGFGVQAGVEEGSDGTGAPGEQAFEAPNNRTAYWFGFVCTDTNALGAGTASVSGRALNWVGWPPFDELVADANEPVRNAYIALANNNNDVTQYVGQADGDGNFSIPDVPAGSYTLSIWDEQLSYIIRFVPLTVSAGQALDLGDVGVSRWFGWLGGYVYFDENNNGVRDCTDPTDPSTCETPVGNTDMDERWRDGSIKDATTTDEAGYYEYPQAEGGPLGKWFINEQGFARFSAFPGASVHNEINYDDVTKIPTDQGGALLSNQLLTEGHRANVDWGKTHYPDSEPGQIVGVTYWATTRNEMDAFMQAHEDYEPGIPDVTVTLEGLGPDGQPGTDDDVVLNKYVTDHWSQPTDCDMVDRLGSDLSGSLNPIIGSRCLEVPINGQESKDGAFDGGYAFADYCPESRGGFKEFNPDGDTVCMDGNGPDPLVAGTYITHAFMPQDPNDERPCNPADEATKYISGPKGPDGGTGCLYRPVREEDVNVDLGAEFQPAITPYACTGDSHLLDQSTLTERSPYFGQDTEKPLCDKRLVTLENHQNSNADFFLMTNQKTGVDVEEPGRIVGLVSDDIYFDRDPQSIWYGEPRPIGNVPIGIRDYAGRLLTTVKTDSNGTYEALLPSTETLNCPIPQGPCPGMYIVTVNDPGDPGKANHNYNPDYLTASMAWDVWPGQTTQLDTPLDPISGIGCDLPLDTPELLEVSKAAVLSSDSSATSRRITIKGDFFGNSPGRVRLTDLRTNGSTLTLGPATNANPTLGNGGLISWTNTQIVIQVPAVSSNFPAGQKQLSITTAGANGATTRNALTLHVLGTGYNPTPRTVGTPASSPHAIQNAIDGANAGDLILLGTGVYHENVIITKRVILQGRGPGGITGAAELQQRQPDDPRFNIQGTTIDGRFFKDADVNADWHTKVGQLGTLPGVDASHPLLGGAGVVISGRSTSEFNIGTTATAVYSAARIDGIGLITADGEGAGGIQLQSYAQNTQVTNNVLEHDAGFFVGGIGVGQPEYDSHDTNVAIRNNRVLGSGGLNKAGGIGIFRGSNGYDVQSNTLCANFGIEYHSVGGIAHWGKSLNGKIRDNLIYHNDGIGSGGGIAISHEQPLTGAGDSSGAVDIDRNLIQTNYSAEDGGGLYITDAHTDRVNVRNNMIVQNGAANLGGAVKLEDSSNVSFVNNTVAENVSTASSALSDGDPHSAGLASEANDPAYQATLPASAARFSNPVAFFNNIFWDNQAYTLSSSGPGATLNSQGFIDLEVHGTLLHASTFTPRYSLLTANSEIRGDGVADTLPGGQANVFGADPLFVATFPLELTVMGSRQDPQRAAVTITGAEPPVESIGNYHLTNASPAIDRGAGYSNYPATRTSSSTLAPCSVSFSAQPFGADFDRQSRPQLRSLRLLTPWDIGADEVPGINIPMLPWSCGGTT
jgi:hypothetical protein